MIDRHRTTDTRASVPAMGPSLPTAVVHIAYVVVAAPLCMIVFEDPFWAGIGLLFAVAGTLLPNLVHKPWLLLVLGACQLWREPSATDIVFYLLLAGLHLLLVIGALSEHVPWRGRIQGAALVRPLRLFVRIQVVVQAVTVAALHTFNDRAGAVPGLSIVAAAMLAIVAFALARGLLRARATASL